MTTLAQNQPKLWLLAIQHVLSAAIVMPFLLILLAMFCGFSILGIDGFISLTETYPNTFMVLSTLATSLFIWIGVQQSAQVIRRSQPDLVGEDLLVQALIVLTVISLLFTFGGIIGQGLTPSLLILANRALELFVFYIASKKYFLPPQ